MGIFAELRGFMAKFRPVGIARHGHLAACGRIGVGFGNRTKKNEFHWDEIAITVVRTLTEADFDALNWRDVQNVIRASDKPLGELILDIDDLL